MTCPSTEAVAPSSTNTVEKPATNRSAASDGAPAHAARVLAAQLVEVVPARIAQIRRHQRQDAGAEEADQPAEKRRR